MQEDTAGLEKQPSGLAMPLKCQDRQDSQPWPAVVRERIRMNVRARTTSAFVFTRAVVSYRLIVVHRALALLLIPALIATSGAVSLLHTHEYSDHDHPEHHHGLSAHEHHAEPAHPDDGTAHLEGCDPGKHAVSFAFVCANPPQVHAVDGEIGPQVLSVPALQIEPAVGYADVRVHGPPTRTQSTPRAPPVIALA